MGFELISSAILINWYRRGHGLKSHSSLNFFRLLSLFCQLLRLISLSVSVISLTVRMPELKMLENVLKPKETPTVLARKLDQIALKKGHLVLKSTIFLKLAGCQ